MTDRKQPHSNESPANQLNDEQLDEVVGGLNPQPLPPRVRSIRLPDYFLGFLAKAQFNG